MRTTFIFIGINIAIFLLQAIGIITGLSFTPATFIYEPYTIITSMFLHSGFYHLLLNMVGLFTFGIIVENEFGTKRFIILYFFTGLAGTVGYMLFGGSPFIGALGASGAIFGLIGGAAIAKPKVLVFTPYGAFPMFVAAIIWGGAEFLRSFGSDGIAQSAHIGGLIAGVIIGFLILKKFNINILYALMAVPIIASVFIGMNLPHQISSYENFPPCFEVTDSKTGISYSYLEFSCQENTILSITTPVRAKFNLAQYSEELKFLTDQARINESCKIESSEIDVLEETAIVTGKTCDSSFRSMGKICDDVKLVTIEFYQDSPSFESLDCSKLTNQKKLNLLTPE